MSCEASLALEHGMWRQLFQSDDAREGLVAYLEKRPVKLRG